MTVALIGEVEGVGAGRRDRIAAAGVCLHDPKEILCVGCADERQQREEPIEDLDQFVYPHTETATTVPAPPAGTDTTMSVANAEEIIQPGPRAAPRRP